MLPGTTNTVTYHFSAGEHALFDFASEASMPLWFTVAEGTETEVDETMLEADVEVLLQDFVFQMPETIPSGETVWYIENVGGQWHEMVILRVEEGTTLEEATAMLESQLMGPEATTPADGMEATEEAGAEATEAEPTAEATEAEATEQADAEATEMPMPMEDMGPMPDVLWMPMEEGERAWFLVNLEPGTYMVVCGLPNLDEIAAGEAPHAHYELGMIMLITVE
jgi:hypothetical protein